MQSDNRTVFNRHKWMYHSHTHIMQRLRYKWNCARLRHSSTQAAGGNGLRFSLTQMCQLLYSLPPPSLGHNEWWTFWMWLCNCNSCLSPKLRGLFMASMEVHVHVERTGSGRGGGALPSAQEWLKPIGWHHARDNSLQESGQRISRGNWNIRGHIYICTQSTLRAWAHASFQALAEEIRQP